MLDPTKLPLFLVASLILLLTPGPAVLYIIARSVDQGRAAGLVSVLSIEIGNFFHVLAATFGLSAILLSSATAFAVVKYLGAAYLIYLGVRKLLAREEAGASRRRCRGCWAGEGRDSGMDTTTGALPGEKSIVNLVIIHMLWPQCNCGQIRQVCNHQIANPLTNITYKLYYCV